VADPDDQPAATDEAEPASTDKPADATDTTEK
jgi:hypothetical protein